MTKLKKNNINAFAYADDLAMIGISKAKLLEAIEIVETWAMENKLIINKRKSGVMIHTFRGREAKEDTGSIRDYPYKIDYTYLGVVIDRNLTLKAHLEKIKEKVQKGNKILYMCNKRGLPEWKRKYLWLTYI